MKLIKFFILFTFLQVVLMYANSNPHLTGAFFQLDGGYNNWSQATWDAKLQDMKNIGMDTIIIQFSAYDNHSYYNSSLTYINDEYPNILPRLMQSADNKGMFVYVATYYQSGWFSRSEEDAYLSTNATRNTNVINELVDNFGITGYASFAGWYIPYEIDGYHNTSSAGKAKLINFFSKIADYCKEKTPTKLVTVSPFFNEDLITPSDYGSYWNDLLSGISNVDIVMLQDGIGAGHLSSSNTGLYFNAVKNACDNNGRTLWANAENFTTNSTPCSIDRLKYQLLLERPYTEKLVTFEYFYYMGKDDVQGKGSTTLYNNYNTYYQSLCTDTNAPSYTEVTPYLGDDKKLFLIFNEKINMVKANQTTNYLINDSMNPSSVEVDHQSMTNIILTFPVSIPSGYVLRSQNIEDLYENKIVVSNSTNSSTTNTNTTTTTNSNSSTIKDMSAEGIYPSPCSMSENEKLLFYFMPNTKINIYNFYAEKLLELTTDSSGIAEWDFYNANGEKVDSGIYFYVVQSPRKRGTIVLTD